MKITLFLILGLTLALGSVPRNRFDPCIFIDCTKLTTTTKAPTSTTTISNNSGNGPKPDDLQKFKSQLVRVHTY